MFIRTQGKGALVQICNINFFFIRENYMPPSKFNNNKERYNYTIVANMGYLCEVDLGKFEDEDAARYEFVKIIDFMRDMSNGDTYQVSEDCTYKPIDRERFENLLNDRSLVSI